MFGGLGINSVSFGHFEFDSDLISNPNLGLSLA